VRTKERENKREGEQKRGKIFWERFL